MAMDKSSADAYVYVKASGILARSFVGAKARELFSVRSLKELWSLIFKKEVPAVPETMLAAALEKEAVSSFVNSYKRLILNYEKPSPLLVELLRFYDYENLKQFGAALCTGQKEIPSYTDISPLNILNYSKWPDIAQITKNSPLSWYDHVSTVQNQQMDDYRMDCQYIAELWKALDHVDSSCREDIRALFKEKFSLENILWSLRLRIYYNMDSNEIPMHLSYAEGNAAKNDPIASPALKTLHWATDDWDTWKHWQFSEFLNPHEEGTVWNIDPRWIAGAYKNHYVEKARKLFHRYPFTECPLVCWFIIKRDELDDICTASESLRMNIPSSEAMRAAGVQEV